MKSAIVERLGEAAVLLPNQIVAALAANDRAKLRLTLLQDAAIRARTPGSPAPDLSGERRAVELEDPAFDATVAGARPADETHLAIPGAARLVEGLASDIGAMIGPVRTVDAAEADRFTARLAALSTIHPITDDIVSDATIAGMTSASRDGPDSDHLLIMDLHRTINRIAAATAVETLDGARAHGLDDRDRRRVKAFMRGLNRTRGLAFGHPGLDTMAARLGARLTIQNDIGATDAHVLVIHVEGAEVAITYTDVHRNRTRFFMGLFDDRGVAWTPLAEERGEGLAEEGAFYMVTGRFAAADEAALDAFLAYLGSRIVFLIDWNKARKALQTFVEKGLAIRLLADAAGADLGHRAFLELGGAEMVLDALRRLGGTGAPAGARLDEILERPELRDFLGAVLRLSSEGLAAGRSARLIRDEIQADLARRLQGAEAAFLTLALRHAGLSRMLAGALRDGVAGGVLAPAAERKALAERATALEKKGDRLTLAAREIAARLSDAGPRLRPVIDEVEHALDALDEAAFLFNLLPDGAAGPDVLEALADLGAVAVESTAQMVRTCEAASRAADGRRRDAVDALQAVDAVSVAERAADDAERRLIAVIMAAPATDARLPPLGLELAHALERATDHMGHAALALRDRLLEELSL